VAGRAELAKLQANNGRGKLTSDETSKAKQLQFFVMDEEEL